MSVYPKVDDEQYPLSSTKVPFRDFACLKIFFFKSIFMPAYKEEHLRIMKKILDILTAETQTANSSKEQILSSSKRINAISQTLQQRDDVPDLRYFLGSMQ